MNSKVKTLYGVYKLLGRDAFLAAARIYSENVQPTVEATLSVMENTWYNTSHTMTEAEKMLNDFRCGNLTKEDAEKCLRQEKLSESFDSAINRVLFKIDYAKLDQSCNGADKSYAGETLKQMHEAFVSVYGMDYLEDGGFEFVHIPAVIRSRNTGKLCLGIVTIDLESSGEHWETDFLTPYGVVTQGDPDGNPTALKYLHDNFFPYDYWYTADVENDLHIDYRNLTEEAAELLDMVHCEEMTADVNCGISLQ